MSDFSHNRCNSFSEIDKVSDASPGLAPSKSDSALTAPDGRPIRVKNVTINHGVANESRKGEDKWLTAARPVPGVVAFGIFDGHKGCDAAIFCQENLLQRVMSGMPGDADPEERKHAIWKAMIAGYVNADHEFQALGKPSGTTASLVIVDGRTITVGAVGDSRCVMDFPGGLRTQLSVDHRFDVSQSETDRVRSVGGEVGRVALDDGREIGPLRLWPSGLAVSRSIGDREAGDYLLPVPHVRQVNVLGRGARIIMGSDGVWDSLDNDAAATLVQGLPPEEAAAKIVNEAVKLRGLKDDVTCIVVDLQYSQVPSNSESSSPGSPAVAPRRKPMMGVLSGFLVRSKSSPTTRNPNLPIPSAYELMQDAQMPSLYTRLKEGMTLHAQSGKLLCASCQQSSSGAKAVGPETQRPRGRQIGKMALTEEGSPAISPSDSPMHMELCQECSYFNSLKMQQL